MHINTAVHFLCINEEINNLLGLPVVGNEVFCFADGTSKAFDIVAPVEVRFMNRRSTVQAIVLPDNTTSILGGSVLLDMDVLIHPLRQELIVNPGHPYFAQMKLT